MVNPSKWVNLKSNFLKFHHRNQAISGIEKARKMAYFRAFLALLSCRLSLAELRSATSGFEAVLKFFDCHFPLIFWAFLPFRFSVVLFLNHKNRCFLLLRFKLQSLKNVSHNTIILKQSNSKTLFPSIF